MAVTGAAGKTGQAVIAALLARGASVRALVRTADHRQRLSGLAGVETVPADMRHTGELAAALNGARVIYHIAPNMHPDEVAMAEAALAAARELGVEHFIYHSVLHPQIRRMPHHWRKLAAEEAVIESGYSFTILQPAAYMQNLRGAFERADESGRYRVPYGPSVRISVVDLDDVAEAAAIVICERSHRGAIYELAGPESPSQQEIAAQMSEVLAKPVQMEQMPLDEWAAEAGAAGLPDGQIDDFIAMYRHYQQHDFIGNPGTLERLLGRGPTPLLDVLRRWQGRHQ